MLFIWVFFGSCGTKPVPFWDELKLVQKTIYRKSSTQNGPRSTIMLVALSGHCPDHARWDVNHDKVQWNRSSWLDNHANLCTTLFCKKLIMLAVTNPVMCHLKFLLQHFCKLYQREIFYNYFNEILCKNLSIKVEAFWSQVLLWNLDLLLSLGGLLNIHKEFWILVCRENVQLPNDKS